MNTKLIMTAAALFLGILGIGLTFLPAELAEVLFPGAPTPILLLQLCGALYIGFAIVNWMAKGAKIGGIYNKPISIGNFAHFTVTAITLVKMLLAGGSLSPLLMGIAVLYIIFAAIFGWLNFRG